MLHTRNTWNPWLECGVTGSKRTTVMSFKSCQVRWHEREVQYAVLTNYPWQLLVVKHLVYTRKTSP